MDIDMTRAAPTDDNFLPRRPPGGPATEDNSTDGELSKRLLPGDCRETGLCLLRCRLPDNRNRGDCGAARWREDGDATLS
jgi:hypothetical protein